MANEGKKVAGVAGAGLLIYLLWPKGNGKSPGYYGPVLTTPNKPVDVPTQFCARNINVAPRQNNYEFAFDVEQVANTHTIKFPFGGVLTTPDGATYRLEHQSQLGTLLNNVLSCVYRGEKLALKYGKPSIPTIRYVLPGGWTSGSTSIGQDVKRQENTKIQEGSSSVQLQVSITDELGATLPVPSSRNWFGTEPENPAVMAYIANYRGRYR